MHVMTSYFGLQRANLMLISQSNFKKIKFTEQAWWLNWSSWLLHITITPLNNMVFLKLVKYFFLLGKHLILSNLCLIVVVVVVFYRMCWLSWGNISFVQLGGLKELLICPAAWSWSVTGFPPPTNHRPGTVCQTLTQWASFLKSLLRLW